MKKPKYKIKKMKDNKMDIEYDSSENIFDIMKDIADKLCEDDDT